MPAGRPDAIACACALLAGAVGCFEYHPAATAPIAVTGASGRLIGARVCRQARDAGLLIRPLGDVLVIMPPLAITEEQLGWMLDVMARCIVSVTSETYSKPSAQVGAEWEARVPPDEQSG